MTHTEKCPHCGHDIPTVTITGDDVARAIAANPQKIADNTTKNNPFLEPRAKAMDIMAQPNPLYQALKAKKP